MTNMSLSGKKVFARSATTDDGLALGAIHARAGRVSAIIGRRPGTPWLAVQRVDHPDPQQARVAAAADLGGGAGGIELVCAGSASSARTGFGLTTARDALRRLLSDVCPARLRLDAGDATVQVFESLAGVDRVEVTLASDPLAEAAARGGFDRAPDEILSEVARLARRFVEAGRPGAAVVADGRVWAAGGASEAQELSGILASLADHARLLVGAGLTPEAALGAIEIVTDAGASQPVTIAKLRALRLLHARIVEAFAAPPVPARIHAETSWRMMSRRDVHTNILRTTSAAFAAGIGGADSITILPFMIACGVPDAFARRLARNTQTILIEEAALGRVGDPGAGSGAIESLTDALSETAWERFRAIEAGGGLLAALRAGSFQDGIRKMRAARADRIVRRETVLVGVSDFPLLDEENIAVASPRPPATEPPTPAAESLARLDPVRMAEPFEELRDHADALAAAGRAPEVFLAGLGASADFVAAAHAATRLYAAGGIRAIDGGGFDGADAAAEAFAGSGAKIACVVRSQEAPGGLAAAVAAALKARGAARVDIMGPATTGPDKDKDATLDGNFDAVAFLGDVLDRIGR